MRNERFPLFFENFICLLVKRQGIKNKLKAFRLTNKLKMFSKTKEKRSSLIFMVSLSFLKLEDFP